MISNILCFFFILNLFKTSKHELNIYSNIKVSFSGASVTRQKIGYVSELKLLFPNWITTVYSYPEVKMSRCTTEVVLDASPDLVFYDWALHDGSSYDEMKEILYLFVKKNVVPVFIIMPRIDNIQLGVIKRMYTLSKELGITVIDLRYKFSQKQLKEELLRDNCHPNPKGAKLYAQAIKEYIEEFSIMIPKAFDLGYHINEIKINRVQSIAYKRLDINLSGKVYDMTIVKDLSSNYLNIYHNFKLQRKILVWDQYCHYSRDAKVFFNFEGVNSTLSIEVLNENIDRSSCRRNINATMISEPRFESLELCYEGELHSRLVDGIYI